MNYEVTIGIPLYNAERFIRRTLESVLAQTFGSIEILVVDDCCTDGSVEIVRLMRAGHPRGADIRIVTQPRNMGVGPARNRIIDEAQGRYLYFMDSDDFIADNAISLLHESICSSGAEIAFGSYEKIEDSGTERHTETYAYPRLELLGTDVLASFAFRKYGGIQAAAWNYLVSVDLLRRNHLRFISAPYWEDMVFTYTLTTFVSHAVLLPDVTYYYMCRDGSLSNYQRRTRIDKAEVFRNVATVSHLKRHALRLQGKPYLGGWCRNVVMTDLYIVCNAIKNRDIISPRLTASELRGFMSHPLRLSDIMRLGSERGANLLLYVLGRLPAPLAVALIKFIGKRKGLI